MTDATDFDLDIDDAWRRFRIDLADRLHRLRRGQVVTVAQSDSDMSGMPSGLLTFTVTSAGKLRCTADLDRQPRGFGISQFRQMPQLGWRTLRVADQPFITETTRREADVLAARIERTLREIWNVVHPTFLDTGDGDGPVAEAAILMGVLPQSPMHLRELVVEALGRLTDLTIVVDDDGDIPLPIGDNGSWIRFGSEEPEIEVCACIVDDAFDTGTAQKFIATESNRWPGVTLRLVQNRIYATTRLDCAVFQARNFSSTLARWLDFIDDDVPVIGAELRGGDSPSLVVPQYDSSDPPESLRTLMYLQRVGCRVSAAQVSLMCDKKPLNIIGLLTLCHDEMNKCSHGCHGDCGPAELDAAAATCSRGCRGWAAIIKNLHAALEHIEKHQYDDPASTRRSGERRPRRR